jgi:hypothetical protein
MNYLSLLASNCDSPDLCLLITCAVIYWHLADFFLIGGRMIIMEINTIQ